MNTTSLIDKVLDTKPILIPAVVCFPVKDQDVLLMRRTKTSDGLGQDLISGIGGKVGDSETFRNETHEEALVREVHEEVGITPTKYRKIGRVRFLWETKPNWNMDVTIYIVEAWRGNPVETDVAKPVWHKISNLPKIHMWEDNHYWLPKVLEGEKVNAIFLYDENKKLSEHRFY